VTNDDRLFGYRLQLFDLARRTSVSEACRTFGVHRSTYYAWKRRVECHGTEILRPRERRAPKMLNQLPRMVDYGRGGDKPGSKGRGRDQRADHRGKPSGSSRGGGRRRKA